MSSFFAVLDDIAVLAKAAAASVDDIAVGVSRASAKAAGVVIDDAAVTPQYVKGISPKRELPVIWRITRGSLLNKAVIIVVIMALSVWAPWLFPWLLIVGGSYLAFEGAEKVVHWVRSWRAETVTADEIIERTEADEKQIVASALRTDIVLSAEIMLIALASIETGSSITRAVILVAVAIVMTVGVYGAVGVLIKIDDVGMWLMKRRAAVAIASGRGLVKAMPTVFRVIGIVGVVAMLWIGGHIVFVNVAEVGWTRPNDLLIALTSFSAPRWVEWIAESGISAIVGLVWGSAVVGVFALVARLRPGSATEQPAHH